MNRVFYLFIILLFVSCGKDNVFLRNAGADMPIHIKGNTTSNVFILYLHGGPGASAFYDEFGGFFKKIEEQYAMVYWEQRAAGISQGNATKESLTVEQFIEGIDQVIALIRELHNNPKIVLMGHSWGGGLGTAYLVSKAETNFNDITAWIEIDGDHNILLGNRLAKEKVLDFAQTQITNGTDVNYWNDAIAWYANTPENQVGLFPYIEHYDFVEKSGGNWYNEVYNYANLSNIFFSQSTGFDFLSNNSYSQEHVDLTELLTYTDQIAKITIPTLIAWGRHDGIIPVALAQDAFDNIGTADEDKYLEIFENAAHSPYVEEIDLFNEKIIVFIQKYI